MAMPCLKASWLAVRKAISEESTSCAFPSVTTMRTPLMQACVFELSGELSVGKLAAQRFTQNVGSIKV